MPTADKAITTDPTQSQLTELIEDGRITDNRVGKLEDGLIRVESSVQHLTRLVGDLVGEMKSVTRPNWALYIAAVSAFLTLVAMIAGLIWFGVSARMDSQAWRLERIEANAADTSRLMQQGEYHRGVGDERDRWLELSVRTLSERKTP